MRTTTSRRRSRSGPVRPALDEVDVNRHPQDSLEPGKQAAEPALLLLLDDRRIADVRRLAQRGVLTQPLRFRRRIDLDVLGVRLAPDTAPCRRSSSSAAALFASWSTSLRMSLGAAGPVCSSRAAWPALMLPWGAFSAICGASVSSACCRSLCSCGRGGARPWRAQVVIRRHRQRRAGRHREFVRRVPGQAKGARQLVAAAATQQNQGAAQQKGGDKARVREIGSHATLHTH